MALERAPIPGTGFGWIRVSKEIENWQPQPKPVTGTVLLILPDDMLEDKALLKTLETAPRNECHSTGSIGFIPVDVETLFPGETVRFKMNRGDFDFDAWARRMVEVPDSIEVRFAYDRYAYGKPLTVTARTLRKGRVVNVKRAIPADRWVVTEIGDILADFARTCPKPPDDADRLTTGRHVQELLATLDASGQGLLRGFLKRDADSRAGTSPYSGSTTTIPGTLLVRAGVRKLTLATTTKSHAILATIEMKGGHEIKDDESGTTVELKAQLPSTLLMALRGRSVGDVVDMPWLSHLKIRTVPKQGDAAASFRAFSENVPLATGAPTPVDDDEIDRRLSNLAILREDGRGDTGVWTSIDTALVPILGTLPRGDLAVVLAKLEMYSSVQLDRYGHEGWTIKGQGPRIVVERQPDVPMTALAHIAALMPDEERKAA